MNISDLHRRVKAQPESFRFLLDEVPNAFAAYSFRKLKSDYNGFCCQISKESSITTGFDIGFVNNEIDINTCLNYANGERFFVLGFYDQSGNSNDMPMTFDLDEPIGLGENNEIFKENGKVTAVFNRTATDRQNILMGASVYNNWNINNVSALIVGKLFNLANTILFQINNAAGNRLAFGATSSTNNYGWRNNNVYTRVTDQYRNERVIGSIYTASQKIFVNDVEATISANPPAASGNSFGQIGGNIGSTTPNTGSLFQELIIYNTDQFTNKSLLDDNINSYYGIF